jgi:hypothetical protein
MVRNGALLMAASGGVSPHYEVERCAGVRAESYRVPKAGVICAPRVGCTRSTVRTSSPSHRRACRGSSTSRRTGALGVVFDPGGGQVHFALRVVGLPRFTLRVHCVDRLGAASQPATGFSCAELLHRLVVERALRVGGSANTVSTHSLAKALRTSALSPLK